MTFPTPPVAGALVIAFFLLSAAVVPLALRRSALTARRKKSLIAAIVVSVAVKLALATLGHNLDLESYQIVSGLMEQGKSVYANTQRYNYGPIWAFVVSGLAWLSNLIGWDAGEGFHVLVAAFLAATDVLIGLALAMAYSHAAALVFLLAPVGLLISGFHAQFDNVAVLCALLAWLMIRGGRPRPAALAVSAGLTGLSLIVKHILFLFPVWLLFWRPLGKLRYRVLYAGVAYAVFFCAFIPWLGDPASRTGIAKNVLGYSSEFGNSLTPITAGLFVPIRSIDSSFQLSLPIRMSGASFQWIPIMSGFKALWLGLMLAAGVALARRGADELFLLYLMALYAFTPAFADQYTAIPLVACAVFHESWASWAFLASGTSLLLVSEVNVLGPLNSTVAPLVIAGRPYLVLKNLRSAMIMVSQICLAALLAIRWRARTGSGEALPIRAKLVRAAALIASSSLYSFL
ncbi:MAG: hypothetical protein Q8N47_27370, partial [Bryobacterales bacterium]|nr:hypothetical protein [Bryobacterales bacterium]